MKVLFDLVGLICVAALLWALGSRAGGRSLMGAVTCVAVVFGAGTFWTHVWPQARSMVLLHESDSRLTPAQAFANPGVRLHANEGFLAWADQRLPPTARVFLDCPEPRPCPNELSNWITYRLTPRVFTDYRGEAQWVLFYGTAGPAAPGIVGYSPGFAIERLSP